MIECWVRRDFRNYLTFSCENLSWYKGFLEHPTDELRAGVWKIAEEIYPGYSLEGLMLKLKLQHFGHLMQRADSLQKTLMLGKIEGRRRSGGQGEMVGRYHWCNGHEFEQALGDREGQGSLACWVLDSPWGREMLSLGVPAGFYCCK